MVIAENQHAVGTANKADSPLGRSMIPWEQANPADLSGVEFIVTDVDDTLTHDGRLEGATLDALARLEQAGIKVIPATAASGGWGSFMINSWPVHAVIAENGGVFLTRRDGRIVHETIAAHIEPLRHLLERDFPHLVPADDQPYRRTSLAYVRQADPAANARVLDFLRGHGAGGTVNSLWLLAWPGSRDKLSATFHLLGHLRGHLLGDGDLSRALLYVGDSENDQPMFRHFPLSVGVSTVVQHRLEHWPSFVTKGPGGAGFVQVAERVLAAKGF